jgi:hypothetical protein
MSAGRGYMGNLCPPEPKTMNPETGLKKLS